MAKVVRPTASVIQVNLCRVQQVWIRSRWRPPIPNYHTSIYGTIDFLSQNVANLVYVLNSCVAPTRNFSGAYSSLCRALRSLDSLKIETTSECLYDNTSGSRNSLCYILILYCSSHDHRMLRLYCKTMTSSTYME